MDLEGRIKVSELHPHPQNEYYFDDMTGDNWDELIRSITTSGVTNAITITQEKVIISGHQRVRACKVLGIDEVSYKMIQYDDEREEIKDLIESNLRQRVLSNPNPIKMGRCFNFLNDYYGFEHGGNRKSRENNFPLIEKDIPNTQTELAESYGIAKQTMSNYMRLTKAIPELEELVDTGIVTSTTALAIMRNLSENEQISLISSLDTTKKITQREVQKYIDEIKQLKTDNPKIKELENKISELETEKSSLERKVKLNQEDASKYVKLKSDIEFLTKQKSDLGRQIDSATELAGLSVRLQKLLEEELAPIKFKRCMETLDSSDVAIGNLTDIITQIDNWSDEMKKLLGTKFDYVIDVQ
jgi:ParB-like chromosome segregation protein Spo0J